MILGNTIRKLKGLTNIDSHMQEVLSGGGISFSILVLGSGLGFLFNVFLARILGAGGSGVYYIAFDITSIAIIIGQLGLSMTLVRTIATNSVDGKWQNVVGTFNTGFLVSCALAITITLLIYPNAFWIAERIYSKPELTEPLQLMSLTILPGSLLALQAASLRGLKKIGASMFLSNLGEVLISLPLLFILGIGLGINGAIIARLGATIVMVALGAILWSRALPGGRIEPIKVPARMLIISSLPFFWLDLINIVMLRADSIFLGIWMSPDDVGVYNATVRTAMVATFFLTAMNSIIAPKFAGLYANKDMNALKSVARNSTKLMAFLGLFFFIPLFVFPALILKLFGPGFTSGTNVLRILSIGQLVNVAVGPVGLLLLMTGNEKAQQKNVFSSALVNVLLDVVLIPSLGIVGAAIASATGLALKNIVSLILVYKKLQIRMW